MATRSCSTKRFPRTSRIAGYIASKSSYEPWWVVAVFPSSRPVWARMKAPVQTDMSRSARFATCRSHSIVAGDSASGRDDDDVRLRARCRTCIAG